MANVVRLTPGYYANPDIGRPISNGFIYVGEVDTDPEIVINQKQISVLQEDTTIVEVAQPLRTSAGGVPIYNNSPVTILVDGSYSIKVNDKLGAQEYYVPAVDTLTTGEVTFDTIADLRLTEGNSEEYIAIVFGYTAIGDGGGGPSRNWSDGQAPGTYVDDGGSVIVPDGGDGSAAWLFTEDTDFDALWFGDPDDITTIINAVAYAFSSGNRMIVNQQFTTTNNIPNLHEINIVGNGSITNGSTVFYVKPEGDQENNLYYSLSGLATNDGIKSTTPRRTLDEIGDILFHYANFLLDGQWIINIAAGTWKDGTTRFNNFPISNYPVRFLGDYSGTYPNQTFNTIIDGESAATQGMYFVIGNLFLEFEGLHFSNWGTKSTTTVVAGGGIYCWIGSTMSATDCKFSESYVGVFNQGRVNTNVVNCIFDEMNYGVRPSYHNRFSINFNTLTNVAKGVSADRMSVGHFDNNDYDGSTLMCVYSQQNSRVSANDNDYKNCNVAHMSDKGGIIIDNDCEFNFGVASEIKLRSLITGNGIDTRYNGQIGVRENMQTRFRQLYNITGDDSEKIFLNSIGTNDRLITIPPGFMYGFNRSFKIKMSGLLTIGVSYSGRIRCGSAGDLDFTIPAITSASTAFKMEIEYFAKEPGDITYPLQGETATAATQFYTYTMEVEGEPLIFVVDDTVNDLFDEDELQVSLRMTIPTGQGIVSRNIEGWTTG